MNEERTLSGGRRETLGERLRRERQLRQLSLGEVARATRVSERMLHALEADDHDALPAPVFVQGYVKSYARVLGLDPQELLELWERPGDEPQGVPAPVTSITAPEGGRRFGLAVALVVLLILLTLALSVVLRPRRRDDTVELSMRGPTAAVEVLSHPMARGLETR